MTTALSHLVIPPVNLTHSSYQRNAIVDADRPIGYFPAQFAAVAAEVLRGLPPDVRQRLGDKLKTESRGPWRLLAKALIQSSVP